MTLMLNVCTGGSPVGAACARDVAAICTERGTGSVRDEGLCAAQSGEEGPSAFPKSPETSYAFAMAHVTALCSKDLTI